MRIGLSTGPIAGSVSSAASSGKNGYNGAIERWAVGGGQAGCPRCQAGGGRVFPDLPRFDFPPVPVERTEVKLAPGQAGGGPRRGPGPVNFGRARKWGLDPSARKVV